MKRPSHQTNRRRQLHPKPMAAPTLIISILLFSPTLLSAQELTTTGTDFWVAIMGNYRSFDYDSCYITASAPRACSVTISNPNSGWSHTMPVGAGSLTTYHLPDTECWQSGSCIVTNKGLHVTATDSVQIWVFNSSSTPSSCDATHILPMPALGSNYIVQTTSMDDCYTTDAHAQFSVLATEDSTTIDIVLTSPTSTGLTAGTTITQMLHAGQVYQVEGPWHIGDFSGTTVTARDCKPIAVFSGASVTSMPSSNTISADHTYQQNLPTAVYSTEWILTPSAWHDTSDFVRITSCADNCVITRNGTTLSTINSGQTFEFKLTIASHVTTSQPAVLYQYLGSRLAPTPGGDWGDAAMFAPNPINQRSKSCTFPCYPVRNSYSHSSKYYVNIVVPNADTSLITLDGNTISGFSSISGTGFSYVRQSITESTHTLTTTGSGFIAHTYGVGEYWEGYIMTLGGTDPSYHAPGFDTITIDTNLCSSTFQWRDTTFAVPLHDTISRCEGTFIFNLNYNAPYDDTIDTAICGDTLRWRDSLLTVPGSYTFSYPTASGCDSVIHLNITQHDSYADTIDTATCYNTFIWDDTTLAVPGFHVLHYTTSEGCDSIVHLTLTQYPSYDFYDTIHIEDGGSHTAPNGQTYHNGDQYADTLQTIYGCDSIFHMTIISNGCSPKIWAPNVFTPRESSNNIFKVVSENVSKMTVSIYQRWGDWVCTFDGLTESWDGTKNGKSCQEGTYVYLIKYETPCIDTSKTIVGTITIIH